MPGKFELYKDKGGKFRFRLKASNGQIILASQGYKTKVSANNGIGSVQRNSAVPFRAQEQQRQVHVQPESHQRPGCRDQ